ncbi:hypothetical protein C5E45_20605 [Nocardia nova]|uniref:Uncharacterized protein n=1 Tax=Nocardia nova TaxID=37330 RepID=A0A2S6AMJ6_9NOCA|nr:hypothetical protein [Nocardia nova]PPJ36448.1 hypothetical protein C5E45_20605 [Nocardia nova]
MNFIAAQDGHVLEQQVKVYLQLRGDWVLDATTVDGSGLESALAHGAICAGEDDCAWCSTPAGIQARQDADHIPLPSGRDLLDMLASAFGVALVGRTELRELHHLRDINQNGSHARRNLLSTLATEFGFQLITDTDLATLREEKGRLRRALTAAAADAIEVRNALAELERHLSQPPTNPAQPAPEQ